MHSLLQDLRYALRQLRHARAFTVTAVITLALGVGANTAIFSTVYALLLRSLPFPDASRLVLIEETHPHAGIVSAGYQDYLDWRSQARSFDQLAAYSTIHNSHSQLVINGHPQVAHATLASANFFSALGIAPAKGRGFLPRDDDDRGSHVAVLSHSLWVNRFGGDPNVIGRVIEIDRENYSVIGVLAASQRFPVDAELWLPLSQMDPEERTNRQYHAVDVIGRLRAGVTQEQASLELNTIAARLAQTYPATNRGIGVRLTPLRESLVGQIRPALLLLLGSSALVLLIACVNVANLLLVRATIRTHEIALRMALGASRQRLLRQFLVESLVLSTAGAMLGVVLAAAAMPQLRSALGLLGMKAMASMQPVALNLPVLGFTCLLAVLTGIAFGAIPALRAMPEENGSLRSHARSIAGTHSSARDLLATAEIALAIVVLFGAMLLLRSFEKLLAVDPGFRTDHLLAVSIDLPPNLYSKDQQVESFSTRLHDKVEHLPGVITAATTNTMPLTPSRSLTRFAVEGDPAPAAGNFPVTQLRTVSPSYFRTLGIGLIAGRMFTAKDVDDPMGMFLVNRAFAERYLSGRNPVDRRLMMNVVTPHPDAVPVVGVVADAKDLGVSERAVPVIYSPGYANGQVLLVRTSGDPAAMAASIRDAVSDIDPNLAVSEIDTMDEVLSDSLVRPRLSAWLLGFFALLSVSLAAVGVYGVLSYTVVQRTREIGVRMALGARPSQVLALILKQGSRMILIGVGVGLAAAVLLAHLVRSLLFETVAADPVSALASTALLVGVGMAAVCIPALRASRTEPTEALRAE